MNATLIPDMLQNNARQVRYAIDHRPAHPSEGDSLELLAAYQILADQIGSLARLLDTRLTAGGERKRLLTFLDRTAFALDIAVPLLRYLPDISPEWLPRDARFKDVAVRVASAANEAESMRGQVETLRQQLNKPRPIVDVSTLPISEEDVQKGNYKSLKESLDEL